MNAEGLPETAVPAPPPGMVVTGRYDQGPGYRINRSQGSGSWLLIWTTHGGGLIRQGAARTRARPGDLVVLGPGVPHSYSVEPGVDRWRFWWTHCQARPAWARWLGPCALGDGMYAVGAPAGAHPRIEAAFHRILTDSRWSGTGAPPPPDEPATPGAGEAATRAPDGTAAAEPCEAAAPVPGEGRVAVAHVSAARELALCALEEVVLLAAAGAHRAPAGPDARDERVRRAEELIAADPGAPHTVGTLAARVALSPSRFAHLFTRQTGVPPMRALREARLRHAARLLESTDLTVERVAAASGFPSPFHFNRVFRESHGVPPGAYRSGERP
ncbi:AraC family transcriptional regulator [Streptomyces humi]|uniref:AraC family transcriptional regulator n=1 Tax=Streptomyces humi TaxID=1428620 RepID=UPI0008FC4828|nr:AraC family transcriptional regulator [Streptomyces humi]